MPTAVPALCREVEQLYGHHSWLRQWLQRKLGNAAEAEDLAHDVYVRILHRIEPVHTREPRALLTTIARRVVIDHWRRRSLEEAWLEALAAHPETVAPSAEA